MRFLLCLFAGDWFMRDEWGHSKKGRGGNRPKGSGN